jgi:hypothetical protein
MVKEISFWVMIIAAIISIYYNIKCNNSHALIAQQNRALVAALVWLFVALAAFVIWIL